VFHEPDPDSRTKDFEGRRIDTIEGGWLLLNHSKYRAIQSDEALRESKRAYMQRSRNVEEQFHSGKSSSVSVSGSVEGDGGRPASKKRPGKFVPDEWQPTDKHRSFAESNRLNLSVEIEKFRDWEFKDAKSDWNRAFSNWLRRCVERRGASPAHPAFREEDKGFA
jgi:hypothetical protein